MSDTLRLILGGRYPSEEKDATHELNVWDNPTQDIALSPAAPLVFLGAFGVSTEQSPGGHSLAGALSESKFTPSGSVQWDVSDSMMLYGSISTGFNPVASTPAQTTPGPGSFSRSR